MAAERGIPRIVEICSDGWRDTYVDLNSAEHIEKMIAEFYTPERIATEIGARDSSWGGYVVAELDGQLLVAGGGGLIEPAAGELFVLYADPRQRRRGGGAAVLEFITKQQRGLGATNSGCRSNPRTDWVVRSTGRRGSSTAVAVPRTAETANRCGSAG